MVVGGVGHSGEALGMDKAKTERSQNGKGACPGEGPSVPLGSSGRQLRTLLSCPL